VDVVLRTGAVCLFQQNFIIPLGEDDIGVGPPDLADAGTGLRGDLRPDIELRLVMLDRNGNTARRPATRADTAAPGAANAAQTATNAAGTAKPFSGLLRRAPSAAA